jgi:hypothetical protein
MLPPGCREIRSVEQMAALMAANRDNQTAEKRLYQGILNMNEVCLNPGCIACVRRTVILLYAWRCALLAATVRIVSSAA